MSRHRTANRYRTAGSLAVDGELHNPSVSKSHRGRMSDLSICGSAHRNGCSSDTSSGKALRSTEHGAVKSRAGRVNVGTAGRLGPHSDPAGWGLARHVRCAEGRMCIASGIRGSRISFHPESHVPALRGLIASYRMEIAPIWRAGTRVAIWKGICARPDEVSPSQPAPPPSVFEDSRDSRDTNGGVPPQSPSLGPKTPFAVSQTASDVWGSMCESFKLKRQDVASMLRPESAWKSLSVRGLSKRRPTSIPEITAPATPALTEPERVYQGGP